MREVSTSVACPCCGLKLSVSLTYTPDDDRPSRASDRMAIYGVDWRISTDLEHAIAAAVSAARPSPAARWTVIVETGKHLVEHAWGGSMGHNPVLDHEVWEPHLPDVSSAITKTLARHFSEARWTLFLRGGWRQEPIIRSGTLEPAPAEVAADA